MVIVHRFHFICPEQLHENTNLNHSTHRSLLGRCDWMQSYETEAPALMYICLWFLPVKSPGALIVVVSVFELQKFSSRTGTTSASVSRVHRPSDS